MDRATADWGIALATDDAGIAFATDDGVIALATDDDAGIAFATEDGALATDEGGIALATGDGGIATLLGRFPAWLVGSRRAEDEEEERAGCLAGGGDPPSAFRLIPLFSCKYFLVSLLLPLTSLFRIRIQDLKKDVKCVFKKVWYKPIERYER